MHREFKFAGLGIAIAAIAFGVQAAHIGPDPRDVLDDDAIVFDFDDPPTPKYDLGNHIKFDFDVELDFEQKSDFDLDRRKGDDETTLEPQISAAFSYDPVKWFRAFLELEFSREFMLAGSDGKNQRAEIQLEQAYITFREIIEGFTLQIGRQRFDDVREWLYDEELDGVRMFYRQDRYGIEASVSREQLVRKNLREKKKKKHINNFHLNTYMNFGDDNQVSTYVLYRDERRAGGEDLLFTGIQATGQFTDTLSYWLEGAIVSGEDGDRDVFGYGFDVGGMYIFKGMSWEPSLTLGFAFGSGDDGGKTDNAFRQSGLQDNNDRFNGVTSFRYYGEVLDPELSNLGIVTAGIGVRPSKRSSVDLVYHHYWQDKAEDDFRDVNIDGEPDGRRRGIGDGLDLIIGYREIENIDIELVGGVFLPGPAFEKNDDPAFFAGIEVKFKF